MGFAAHWVLTFLSKYFTQFQVWNTCLFSIVDEDKLTKYWHLCKVLLKRDSIEFFGHWVSPVWSGFLWHGTWFLTLLSGHLWPFFQLLKKNVFPQASILMMTCCQKIFTDGVWWTLDCDFFAAQLWPRALTLKNKLRLIGSNNNNTKFARSFSLAMKISQSCKF